jgi:hypothetical protein
MHTTAQGWTGTANTKMRIEEAQSPPVARRLIFAGLGILDLGLGGRESDREERGHEEVQCRCAEE